MTKPIPAPAAAAARSACDDALAEDLGWALGVVFRGYVAAATTALADVPGGPRGYQVIAAAARSEVGSQLALAHHLGIDRTVMTYMLDDLEAAGLIERQPDPADRRARRVIVTAQGTKLLATLDSRLQAAEADLLAPLNAAERMNFRSQLQAVAAHVNALDPPESLCSLAEQVNAEVTAPNPLTPAGPRP
ncbi:MAG TPA: MarR family winged helix-turn-helix transcriptional regulator [Actinomycetota bacterium]|nr:MarR family winged helix-turn-helix transcriptional regulator [Actinomycetota bacterium]